MQSFINEGDEIICIEPAFDIYLAQIQMAGGRATMIPLHLTSDGEWKINIEELSAAITPATKAIIINTPHNVSV
jgi:aspartate/methionine/tyrosine aminotransferase